VKPDAVSYCKNTHWEKSCEHFGKIPYVTQNLPILFSKWANNSPILRKKWENPGKHTKFTQNVLAISPSAGIPKSEDMCKKLAVMADDDVLMPIFGAPGDLTIYISLGI